MLAICLPFFIHLITEFYLDLFYCIGRPASPIHLLVLVSLRKLTRNVTDDELYEDTGISSRVHAEFFKLFMNWYSTKVFLYWGR